MDGVEQLSCCFKKAGLRKEISGARLFEIKSWFSEELECRAGVLPIESAAIWTQCLGVQYRLPKARYPAWFGG
jgi:hypothetical protein